MTRLLVVDLHLHHHVRSKYLYRSTLLSLNYFKYLVQEPTHEDPCNPSPCGSNTLCNNGICSCIREYHGDPYTGCRPECVLNSDCPQNKACLRSKCVDPCPGTCSQNAICEVLNHIPMCSCPRGMEGNAFVQCRPVLQGKPITSLKTFLYN